MKFKICLILSLLLFSAPIICHAKSIEINHVIFDVDYTLDNGSFVYNPIDDTLIIRNLNISIINTSEDLKIILEGDNYITNSYIDSNGIHARNLEITGEGTLTINTKETAIEAESIIVANTTLNIDTIKSAFAASDGNIVINNSIINATSNDLIFNTIYHDINITNSNIFVNKTVYLIGEFTNNLNIINSYISVNKCTEIGYSFQNIYINGESNIYIHSLNNEVPCNRYIIDGEVVFLESSDNNIFSIITDYSKTPEYLQIITTETNENLINLEDELNQKQQELNDLEELLEDKEKELLERLNNINTKEEELSNYQQELYSYQDLLEEKNNSLNNKENKLNNLEEIINSKEQELVINEEQLNNKEINLTIQQEKFEQNKL